MSEAATDGPTDGLVVVDKASGMTSHDVVSRLRRLAHTRRVGHAGTLDPMATGVLVVGVGRATRLLTHLVLTDKSYTATIRLGETTVSDDADGQTLATVSAEHLTEAEIVAATAPLTGHIEQVPSAVSAIKVDGQRAYARVRAGEAVELAARSVHVSRFDALAVRPGERTDVDVVVECSSGTYVRALARDLGAALGVGGHLTALRRTRVGPFEIAQARTLEHLATVDDPVTLPLADAVRAAFAVRGLHADETLALGYGRSLEPNGIDGVHGAAAPDGTLVALLRESDGRSRPVVVFAPAG